MIRSTKNEIWAGVGDAGASIAAEQALGGTCSLIVGNTIAALRINAESSMSIVTRGMNSHYFSEIRDPNLHQIVIDVVSGTERTANGVAFAFGYQQNLDSENGDSVFGVYLPERDLFIPVAGFYLKNDQRQCHTAVFYDGEVARGLDNLVAGRYDEENLVLPGLARGNEDRPWILGVEALGLIEEMAKNPNNSEKLTELARQLGIETFINKFLNLDPDCNYKVQDFFAYMVARLVDITLTSPGNQGSIGAIPFQYCLHVNVYYASTRPKTKRSKRLSFRKRNNPKSPSKNRSLDEPIVVQVSQSTLDSATGRLSEPVPRPDLSLTISRMGKIAFEGASPIICDDSVEAHQKVDEIVAELQKRFCFNLMELLNVIPSDPENFNGTLEEILIQYKEMLREKDVNVEGLSFDPKDFQEFLDSLDRLIREGKLIQGENSSNVHPLIAIVVEAMRRREGLGVDQPLDLGEIAIPEGLIIHNFMTTIGRVKITISSGKLGRNPFGDYHYLRYDVKIGSKVTLFSTPKSRLDW